MRRNPPRSLRTVGPEHLEEFGPGSPERTVLEWWRHVSGSRRANQASDSSQRDISALPVSLPTSTGYVDVAEGGERFP